MQGVLPDKDLHILHFNVRSLYPKHALVMLKGEGKWCALQRRGYVMTFCELEVSIPGYSCVRCDRNRHGGGVALFISDKLEYQVTMCGPNELEFLLVSVHSTNNVNEKVYIGLWYRPPANSAALDDLYSIFESLDISVFF